MTNQEAERILNPATSREALLPYALDCQHRMALLDEACRVACASLRGPQWISVKERLPDEKQRVLVRCKTVGTTVGWRLWGEWMTDLGDGGSEVTHWMPLPDAPEVWP